MLHLLMLALLMPIGDLRSTPQSTPWQTLEQYYLTPPLSNETVTESTTISKGIRTTLFTFPSTTGDTVHGLLLEPINAHNAPCVIVAHGTGSDKYFAWTFAPALLKMGFACAAIDAPDYGDRANPAGNARLQEAGGQFMELQSTYSLKPASELALPDEFLSIMHGEVLDSRRTLDYLGHRKEIDPHRIGLIAMSMGSIESVILIAVDPRIRCAALEVGGAFGPLSFAQTPAAARSSSSGLYAPYVRVPVFCLCALNDTHIPRSATDALLSVLPHRLTTVRWYNTDHELNDAANADAAQWTISMLRY